MKLVLFSTFNNFFFLLCSIKTILRWRQQTVTICLPSPYLSSISSRPRSKLPSLLNCQLTITYRWYQSSLKWASARTPQGVSQAATVRRKPPRSPPTWATFILLLLAREDHSSAVGSTITVPIWKKCLWIRARNKTRWQGCRGCRLQALENSSVANRSRGS